MWKSASASGSPDSMLTGPSPDSVSSTVTGLRLGSGAAADGRGLTIAGSAAFALLDEDVVSSPRGAPQRPALRRSSRAPSAFFEVLLGSAALAPHALEQHEPPSSAASRPSSDPPVVEQSLEQRSARPPVRRPASAPSGSAPSQARLFGGGRGRSAAAAGAASIRPSEPLPCRRPEPWPRGCTRLGGRGTALQRREFGVAHFEQARASASSRLELLHAGLQVARRRGCRRRGCRRRRGRGGGRRRGALLRRHQAQASAIGRLGAAAVAPSFARRRTGARLRPRPRDAEIADTSLARGMRSVLPERSTLMLPSNAGGLFWKIADHRAVDVRARARDTRHSRSPTACRSCARGRCCRARCRAAAAGWLGRGSRGAGAGAVAAFGDRASTGAGRHPA